jgi:hypothetical protein
MEDIKFVQPEFLGVLAGQYLDGKTPRFSLRAFVRKYLGRLNPRNYRYKDKEETLPNGMKKDIVVVVNPKPNLHLNIGKH